MVVEEGSAPNVRLSKSSDVNVSIASSHDIANSCDPIVVLGGDGTLIGVAHYIKTKWPVMIGVNFGNLGFLTEIAPDELMKVLEDFEAHRGIISERRMLQATVFRQKEEVFKGQAVNEVAILKAVEAPLLELDLLLDDEDMLRLRADGLLVATTTGSTAYSLSAGGSIVHPDVPAMLITPIMPHLLAIRPLVMPLDSKFKTSVLEYKGRVSLSLDGQVHFELKPNDDILITQAKTTVRFLRSPSKTYFEILRQKLSWGSTGVKRK